MPELPHNRCILAVDAQQGGFDGENDMKFTITRRIGSLLLAAWLILTGLSGFGLSFPGEGAILAHWAIGAGIFILLER